MPSTYLCQGPASVLVDTVAGIVVTVVAGDMTGTDPGPGRAWTYVDSPYVHAGPGDVRQPDGTFTSPVALAVGGVASVTATVQA